MPAIEGTVRVPVPVRSHRGPEQDSTDPLMLDYLADRADLAQPAAAAELIERAVAEGFAGNRLRPMEFGGDMGTKAVTAELIDLVRTITPRS